ncbi:MAG: HemK2/MTQ2 family protein methyltransferase [Candidatus Pacearchaeota archaeon]
MNEIYQPSDDSYFFSNFLGDYLKDKPQIKYLDMGAGSGILSEKASEFIDKKNILAVDVNHGSVKLLREKGFNSIKSDLFQKVKGWFDLITFNAPYLPEDEREPKDSVVATTGGKRGDEISVKFLRQAKKHLNKEGRIFLLISSFTPLEKIKKFNPKIVARKKIFFEELMILEIM